jgi:hypothetical protein
LTLHSACWSSGQLRASSGGWVLFFPQQAARSARLNSWLAARSKRLAIIFFPAAMLRLDARRDLCCFDTARLDTKRLDARWLLIIFFSGCCAAASGSIQPRLAA